MPAARLYVKRTNRVMSHAEVRVYQMCLVREAYVPSVESS